VIPWDFIWVEGGKGKRIEDFYRSVDASFHLPNCCGPLRGGEFIAQIELFMRDVYRSVDASFHLPNLRWTVWAGSLLVVRTISYGPTGTVWAGSLLFMRTVSYGPTGYCCLLSGPDPDCS
jgi:hypothetical protein